MAAAADAVVRRVLVRIVRRSVTVVALGCSVLGNLKKEDEEEDSEVTRISVVIIGAFVSGSLSLRFSLFKVLAE